MKDRTNVIEHNFINKAIVTDTDRYGRLIAKIILPDGRDLNAELAWHYKQYNQGQHYADLENSARESKIGLWSDSKPIPPWDYRKGVRNEPIETQGKYVASKNSDKYHRTNCQWAQRISQDNLIHFKDKKDVEKQGYKPCGVCKP